jgi:hypothetical protein
MRNRTGSIRAGSESGAQYRDLRYETESRGYPEDRFSKRLRRGNSLFVGVHVTRLCVHRG